MRPVKAISARGGYSAMTGGSMERFSSGGVQLRNSLASYLEAAGNNQVV